MPSLRGRFFRWLVQRSVTKGSTYLKPLLVQRQEMEATMSRIKPSRKVTVQAVDCSGVPGEWIIPKTCLGGRTLLYCHGGGYYNGSLKTHRAFVANLAIILKAKALHFAYRLAPEHPFPAGVDDSVSVYRWLVENTTGPGSIVVAGESAGGNLALTILLQARTLGLPMPVLGVLLSPHLDFTFSGAAIQQNAESEILYTLEELQWMRGLYLGDDKATDETWWRDERVSPLWADLSGLPPILVHADSTEMLRDDAVVLAERIRLAGGRVELKVWDGLFHAFPLVSMIPEAKQALREIAAFAENYW
ncbi:MAG: alpha/beta hydrolase [Magnetococcales bacterium]|nr:alpha/beta hydrolase [Magnetococcales bacterium]